MGEKWPMNLARNARLPRIIQLSFTCRKSTTWDRRLYFPSEGRPAEDFFALKNPTASAGFENANLEYVEFERAVLLITKERRRGPHISTVPWWPTTKFQNLHVHETRISCATVFMDREGAL